MTEADARWRIRCACEAEAEAIGQVIRKALRHSNARDYPPEVVERVAGNFDTAGVCLLMARRQVFVALVGDRVAATASLDGEVVRTVFVDPDQQGRGLGKALMTHVEQVASRAGVRRLSVPASLTAEGFYAALGYERVREVVDGDERTWVMARQLGAGKGD